MFSLLPPGEDSHAAADVLDAITAFLQPHITQESRNAQAVLALQGNLAQYMLDGLQKVRDISLSKRDRFCSDSLFSG